MYSMLKIPLKCSTLCDYNNNHEISEHCGKEVLPERIKRVKKKQTDTIEGIEIKKTLDLLIMKLKGRMN